MNHLPLLFQASEGSYLYEAKTKARSKILLYRDYSTLDSDISRPQLSRFGSVATICVEKYMVAVKSNIQSTWTVELPSRATSDEQRLAGFLIKSPSISDAIETSSIARVVERSSVTVTAKEENVHPAVLTFRVRYANKARGFDEWTVSVVTIENPDGLCSFGSDAVGFHLLK